MSHKIKLAFQSAYHEQSTALGGFPIDESAASIMFETGARWMLYECLKIAQEHHDTVDGSDGTPSPNLAMRITNEIKEYFGVRE